jgi:hypothetical protein
MLNSLPKDSSATICDVYHLNSDVTSPVTVEFNLKDRLSELRLAVTQTRLQDLYEDVKFEVEQNVYGDNIRMRIWFTNPADQVHFVMSQRSMADSLEWLSLEWLQSQIRSSHPSNTI